MSKQLRVALLIESSRSYGRQLLKGIAAYVRTHDAWTFFHEERALAGPINPRLKTWKPDGIIGRLMVNEVTRFVRRLDVPTVDLYHVDKESELPGIPGVTVDQESLIRLAIGHFLERGFKNFAYCGFRNLVFSELRARCFVQRLAERGFQTNVFTYPGLRSGRGLAEYEEHAMQFNDRLFQWLHNLPKPVALFACNDWRARQILTICSESDIAVPDDVAVLGVDNDDVECELSNPPLSSIDPNVEQIGYQAAALLDRLMKGEVLSPVRSVVPALGIVTRRSTDVLVVDEPDAAEAIQFVRKHACEGVIPEDVAKHLCISQKTLCRWFKKNLGRSPTEEIIRVQVEHIQELLQTTNLTLEQIAPLSGFTHVESMQRIFKRMVGITPGKYRKQMHRAACPFPS
jgi:LacI family transcriptional regulator